MTTHVVALSGGKDSTALAVRLNEVEPRDYTYLITPTGDELPEMVQHWQRLEKLLGKPLTRVTAGTLNGLIDGFNALPNHRQRWCTRMLKIEPCLRFLREHQPAVLYVGLRADEEERKGIYSEEVECRFPLREWGWDEGDVVNFLFERGIAIPRRTDCARCYDQGLLEWRRLWRDYPDLFAEAEAQEAKTGHTFRSPSRDTWPAALKDLRAEFESGRRLRGQDEDDQGRLFGLGACRVCSL